MTLDTKKILFMFLGSTPNEENLLKHWIILNKHNKFNQWSCNVGVDTLFINKDGDITGSCGEMLYNLNKKFNIYSSSFVEDFDIDIIPTQCTKSICICQDEANVDKESKLLEKK